MLTEQKKPPFPKKNRITLTSDLASKPLRSLRKSLRSLR